MKNKIYKVLRLVSICIPIMMTGCDKKNITGSVGDTIAGIFGEEKVNTIDLFDKTAPAPSDCYSGSEVSTDFSIFRGHVNACVDIMLGNSDLITFFETKRCINNIGDKFKLISSQACKDVVIASNPGGLEEIYKMLLDGYFDKKVLTDTGSDFNFNWDNGLEPTDPNYEPIVANYFSLLGAWQNQTRDELYKLEDDLKVFSKKQADFIEDHIVKKFWDGLQTYSPEWKNTFGQIPSTKEDDKVQKEKLFDVFETLLAINKRVLDEVFASDLTQSIYKWDDSASLGPSPLVAVFVGDAFAPFLERARTITKIYDIACKLNSCYGDFYEDNLTVWLLDFFKSIGEGQPAPTNTFSSIDSSNFRDFVEAISNQSDVVIKSIAMMNNAFGVSNIHLVEPGEDFPFLLRSFYSTFALSHDLISRFRATEEIDANGEVRAGFFHGGGVSEIAVGFGKINMDRHIAEVTKVNSELQSLSESFKGKHNQIINETLQINSSQITLESLDDKFEQQVTQILDTQNQIDSIRFFISERREKFGDEITRIIAGLGSSSETFVKVGGTQTIEAFANSSNEGNGNFTSLGKYFITMPDTVQVGDLVKIGVEGEYQPNCAISSRYSSSVSGSRTGPRGYNLSHSSGQSRVQSTDKYKMKESFSSVSVSAQACIGYSTSIGGSKSPWSFSAKACANAEAGSRSASGTRTSDTTSNSVRSDASFDLGLTLANTPFPQAPAGALLFVEMPVDVGTGTVEDNKYKYRTVKTLNYSNSIVLNNEDAKANHYLVVNDCISPSNSGSLIVTIDQYRASGAMVQQFIDKVTAMIPVLETQVAGLIENGILGEGTLATLRSQLIGSDLGGTDLISFSGNIRILLESFIDSQLDILRYKSQISSMERALEMRKLELKSLLNTFENEGDQRFLKVSQRNWNLANLDLDFVNQSGTNKNLYTLNRVINIFEHSLVSYLDFKYNEERKRAMVGNVRLLTKLDMASPFDEITLNINTFMTELLDRLTDDLNNRPFVPKVAMGVHIPNPYYVAPVGFPAPRYDYPVMDGYRAKVLWDEVYAWKRGAEGKTLNVELLFNDLYQSQVGLGCYVEAPIIDSFGMYFLPENEGYVTDFNKSYRNRNAKFFLKGLSKIPFANEARDYNFVNQDWRFIDVATRMAISGRDAIDRLAQEFPANGTLESGLGTGRSPFGEFQIGDLPAYRLDTMGNVLIGDTPLNQIRELFLAYNLAASNSDFNVNLSWLSSCQ